MKNKLQKIERLETLFPKAWFKDGAYFSGDHHNAIWSGEGSEIGNDRMFNAYASEQKYQMGVHTKLAKALDKMGLWAESYDAGTWFIWEN